jgi:hypothetical protein
MELIDQSHIEVVRKIHMTIDLHTKILEVHWLEIKLSGRITVFVIPMDHGT